MLVAVINGLKVLLSLLEIPGTCKENRQTMEWLAAEEIEQNWETMRRRLAYYHLWIDSGLLSKQGKWTSQLTMDRLENWVSEYEADLAGRKK